MQIGENRFHACIHVLNPFSVRNGFSLLLILLAMIHHPSVIDLATHRFFENIAFTRVFFSHFFHLSFSRARLWVQVIHELRSGVRLKKTDYTRTPIEFELTPYEILMDDIRSKRYKLNKVKIMFFDLLSTFTWVGFIVKVKRVQRRTIKWITKVLKVRKTFKMLPASTAFMLKVILSSKTTICYFS